MLNELKAKLNETLSAWVSWQAERASDTHASLVGQPYVVATDDAALALRINGATATPVQVTPGLCGVSHFTRKDAEHVARLRGAPYRAVWIGDIPKIRERSIRAMLAAL